MWIFATVSSRLVRKNLVIVMFGYVTQSSVVTLVHFSAGNCRYQYTEQPVSLITCNPYTNGRLATLCTVTIASNEEYIDVLTWNFVSEAGNKNRLSSESSGVKYTITQTNVGSL